MMTPIDRFSVVRIFQVHEPKMVGGIVLPLESSRLYTGGHDGKMRRWNLNHLQEEEAIDLGGEIFCMATEGPWVFAGLLKVVKAWNTHTCTGYSLDGPIKHVYSLVVGHNMLFAGTGDGTIFVWEYVLATNGFKPKTSIKGHTQDVNTLVVNVIDSKWYSGSMDKSIKVWSLITLDCLQTLSGHTDGVMAVLWWENSLVSASLDKTIKVWTADNTEDLEMVHSHPENHGLLAMFGMLDSKAKPVLLCSGMDKTVRVYDFPTFNERGRIPARANVRCIEAGLNGWIFTGDVFGEMQILKWH